MMRQAINAATPAITTVATEPLTEDQSPNALQSAIAAKR
jgi:hypothetical protein